MTFFWQLWLLCWCYFLGRLMLETTMNSFLTFGTICFKTSSFKRGRWNGVHVRAELKGTLVRAWRVSIYINVTRYRHFTLVKLDYHWHSNDTRTVCICYFPYYFLLYSLLRHQENNMWSECAQLYKKDYKTTLNNIVETTWTCCNAPVLNTRQFFGHWLQFARFQV